MPIVPLASGLPGRPDAFKFLAVGKYEARKGFDVLLDAFYAAFTADDNVVLLILTRSFHSSTVELERVFREVRWAP